jgi:hypothetical protein
MPIYPMISLFDGLYRLKLGDKMEKKSDNNRFFCGFFLNLYWVLVYTAKVNPVSFLSGNESRRNFYAETSLHIRYLNTLTTHLPEGATIMFLYGGQHGNDGYYLNRDYYFDSVSGVYRETNPGTSGSPEEVQPRLSVWESLIY